MNTNHSRPRPTRRRFLQLAAGTVGALTAGARAHGANNRIQLAFIGVGGMGTGHVGTCAAMDDVDIVAVCDVDKAHRDRAASVVDRRVKTIADFRDVLERKDVDAVVIATPEHWHPYIAIHACAAGKDVYVEKPLGHNIREGRLVVEAERAYGRVVQIGLQQRSGAHWQSAVERIHAGELGTITMVNAWNVWNPREMRGGFGHPPNGSPPPGVDYDMWLGPAPLRAFNPARFHDYWYYFWDYSGGMVSGWGVHLFDVVDWALGGDIRSVSMSGGNYFMDDSRETPDTAEAVFACPGYVLTYGVRHANGWRTHDDMDHGIEFFGDKGTLQINRAGYRIFREEDRSSRTPFYSESARTRDYHEHFRDCFARVRDRGTPRADATVGHRATSYGHLANISYRVGRTVRWDARAETIIGDDVAAALLTRQYREPWRC